MIVLKEWFVLFVVYLCLMFLYSIVMILLDGPYISEFLRNTITANNLPVVSNSGLISVGADPRWNILSEQAAIEQLESQQYPIIYTASENSIGWIIEKLPGTKLAEFVSLMKNKVRFRDLIKPLYPNFYYKEVSFSDITSLNSEQLQFPFVIKPAVGFFSLGVYVVDNAEQWPFIRKQIIDQIHMIENLYPNAVLDIDTFIIEQVISGREFAFDAYYDLDGKPVILNIMEHLFAGPDDVSDRIYFTSKQVIEENLTRFTKFLSEIGELAGPKHFPLHVEVRVDDKGKVTPIEVNPLRFGGWCTTADISWYSYGVNQYLTYLNQEIPDWERYWDGKDDKVFALVVLDNSTGTEGKKVSAFDYETVLSQFENPLELRKTNWTKYPLFGYFFTETRKDNMDELFSILSSDLCDYIS